jgi:hypothetical protein
MSGDPFAVGRVPGLRAWAERTSLTRSERVLWATAVVTMFADVGLTAYGLEVGLRELNPVSRAAYHGFGVAGLVWLKLVALSVAVAGRLLVPDRYGDVVPAMLVVPWLAGSAFNVVVLLVAT